MPPNTQTTCEIKLNSNIWLDAHLSRDGSERQTIDEFLILHIDLSTMFLSRNTWEWLTLIRYVSDGGSRVMHMVHHTARVARFSGK